MAATGHEADDTLGSFDYVIVGAGKRRLCPRQPAVGGPGRSVLLLEPAAGQLHLDPYPRSATSTP